MVIMLDKTYYARPDSKLLGYMGETESRTVKVQGHQTEGADRYILRLSYADGAQYDVDITDGTYNVQASLLRAVGDVKCQILAVKTTDENTYEYVKKSNVFNVTIKPSVGGDTPVPTYEETVAVLDKVLAAEIAADECIAAADTATSAANTASSAAETAVENADIAVRSAETATKNAETTTANRQAVEQAATETLSARDTAVSAADKATEKAQTAINSATTASTAAETAVQANNAAQTARTAAEQAAMESEDNKTTAVNAAQTATQAAQTANNAADVAVSARDTAVAAQADVTAKAQAVSTSAAQVAEDRQAVQEVAESIPTDYSGLSEDVSQLKGDLSHISSTVKSPNLLNPNDDGITEQAQIKWNGSVGTNPSWTSSVTNFISVDSAGSKTIRCTIQTNIKIGEYKEDGTFIIAEEVNNTSPVTLNSETTKIRIEFYRTQLPAMIYLSDIVLPYEDYYVKKEVKEEVIPDSIVRKADLLPIETEISGLNDRITNLEEYEITNYALFVDTYEGKAYDSNGNLTNNANYNSTSMCILDRTRPIRPSNISTGHAVFFDENKSYISTVNCYSESPVGVSAYPENAVYVAFDYYAGSYLCGEWGTYWKSVIRGSSLQKVSLSHTKKRKGTRPVINIYTRDTQMEILAKLCDAFHTEDCDVVFERGEYTFDSVFVEMYEKGQRNYIELPIGGRCRYYFNGSTLIADQSIFNESGYSGTISLLSCIYNSNSSESYELYDGTLIGKGITYVVHDECGSKPNWYYHRYKNMKFVYQTDSQTNAIRKPIGGGTGLFGESIFKNCTFETDNTYDLSFHGIATDREDVSDFKLILSNCYLSKNISLDKLATNQTASLLISGCSAQNIHQTGVSVNGWNVTSWCNEVRTE